MVVALEFVAARVIIAPRPELVVAVRDAFWPSRVPGLIIDVRVRVAESVRGAIGIEPARVASVFWARVAAFRVGSVLERAVLPVVRDAFVWVDGRTDVDAPSRTADNAGASANKPRIAPKIRIFFISGNQFSKNGKCGAREK